MLALLAHPAAEHERMGEDALQFSVAPDLARDVARDLAEIGSDRLQRPVGALELFGVGLALMGDQRVFAGPLVGLAQLNAGFLGQPHQPLARPISTPASGAASIRQSRRAGGATGSMSSRSSPFPSLCGASFYNLHHERHRILERQTTARRANERPFSNL
jgi:hypothetical protein